jgi:hypothetical protein
MTNFGTGARLSADHELAGRKSHFAAVSIFPRLYIYAVWMKQREMQTLRLKAPRSKMWQAAEADVLQMRQRRLGDVP